MNELEKRKERRKEKEGDSLRHGASSVGAGPSSIAPIPRRLRTRSSLRTRIDEIFTHQNQWERAPPLFFANHIPMAHTWGTASSTVMNFDKHFLENFCRNNFLFNRQERNSASDNETRSCSTTLHILAASSCFSTLEERIFMSNKHINWIFGT